MNTEPRTDLVDGTGLFVDAARHHERLRGALSGGGALALDLSEVGAADISFVQLLVSAALTAEHAGQVLQLSKPSPTLREAFDRAGIAFDSAAGRILFKRGS